MAIDLSLLKRLARDEVIRHIETGHLEKDLIIEASLINPLERIIGISQLKERGIAKIFKLDSINSSKSKYLIYIISTDTLSLKTVINHVKSDLKNNIHRNRLLLFYPGKNIVTDYLLETEGIFGEVTVDELVLNFIPLELDVLSMEYPIAFRQLFVDRSLIPLFNVARALMNLQSIYGEIPSVYTIGNYSFKLVEMWRKTMHGSLPSTTDVPPEIGHLIIIDRDVDPVTVCSSQLTFEGLLSEVFSIKSGFIEPSNTKEKFLLSDIEPIFNEIRNYPIDKVVPVIQENVKKVQETKMKSMEISSVLDMKQFIVSDLKQTQEKKLNLSMYLNFWEEIMKQKKSERFDKRLEAEDDIRKCFHSDETVKYIEWCIISQREILSCLKLLCLWNCTKHKNINHHKNYFMDIFLQSYGFSHLSTFFNLERSEFYTNFNSEQKINYKNKIDEFDLIPNKKESDGPDDISAVFDGKYRPLSSTLIEKIISQMFPKIDSSKYFSHGIQSYIFSDPEKISDEAKNVYGVFYLGGICYTEITCLRLLSKKYKKKIIVMTTSIINGLDIMSMHIDSP